MPDLLVPVKVSAGEGGRHTMDIGFVCDVPHFRSGSSIRQCEQHRHLHIVVCRCAECHLAADHSQLAGGGQFDIV